jgi:hypothetical protein
MKSKPFKELAVADLDRSPVWQWGSEDDDGDELQVRPVALPVVPKVGPYHVAAHVQASNGASYVGLIEFYDGELASGEVAIVSTSGGTWVLGQPPHGRKETAWFQERFHAAYSELLPVKWRALALVEGESKFREGTQGVA